MDVSDFHDCDGTCDRQGRSCAQVEANERIAVWLFQAGAVLVVALVVYLIWKGATT